MEDGSYCQQTCIFTYFLIDCHLLGTNNKIKPRVLLVHACRVRTVSWYGTIGRVARFWMRLLAEVKTPSARLPNVKWSAPNCSPLQLTTIFTHLAFILSDCFLWHFFSDIDDCVNHRCQNGGTCIDADSSYRCFCRAGYAGQFCETNVDECQSTPCTNGGNCTDLVNDFVCSCPNGWKGKFCASREFLSIILFPLSLNARCFSWVL